MLQLSFRNHTMSDLVIDPKRKVFLSAGWRHLVLLNYAVPDEVLLPFLPKGCELDRYEGSAFASIVAFMFVDTRVFGIKWPGFTTFPELNLRFYVQHQGQRGVCFVREYVPSRLVAAVARWLYNEPYKSARMRGVVNTVEESITAEYEAIDGPARFWVRVNGDPEAMMPAESSREHFFKEHELGVGRDRRGRTLTYHVHHPHWRIFPFLDYELEVDPAALYGDRFACMERPASVVFAEGSAIVVYAKD